VPVRITGWAGFVRLACPLLLLLALAACSGGSQRASTGGALYGYAPPGPPEDPWGPYITEAAHRFSVPDRWIRAVMHQESGGHEYLNGQPITSDAGATGLMQVMPATYAELRDQYNLGSDPYNPHDNIIAGTGYIRQMYDRFGSPAFLAAYNAGPNRVADYLAGNGSLPNETVNYLASIAPRLGNDLPMSGPLVAYADAGGAALTPDPVPHAYARAPISRCWQDPDAAYDPAAPCRAAPPPMRVAAAPAPVQHYAAARANCWHDPDAAYDPSAPCQTPPPVTIAAAALPAPQPQQSVHCWHDPNAAYDPDAPCRVPPTEVAEAPAPQQYAQAGATMPGQALWGARAWAPPPAPAAAHHNFASYLIPSAAAAELPPRRAPGAWAIQVGAFEDPGQARQMAEAARSLDPTELRGTRTTLGATSPFGGHVLYRARLLGLTAQDASHACSMLAIHSQACVTVPPGG
jgi:D-alanyl-D-alanine carboxypeptidase